MLEVEGLEVSYAGYLALSDVSLRVREGEVVCLMGANGSGKSSLLNAVSGLVTPSAGRVRFNGEAINQVPTWQRLGRGLAHVLERRRLFPYMTVLENLLLGGYEPSARSRRAESLERVFALFPILAERRRQLAYSLSGGEQQMVAIGRALMTTPKLILLDEPSLGLAPKFVSLIFDKLTEMKQSGYTMMVVEQNAAKALAVADRAYVLELGRNRFEGPGRTLLEDPEVKRLYLGG